MVRRLLCTIIVAACAVGAVACSGDTDTTDATTDRDTASGEPVGPPRLPDDFTWTGRYIVPDLDVEVPFHWHGADGDFQMVAGGEDDPIHFTNLIVDGQLYTFTHHWPDVETTTCSHVGPATVDEFNDGLAEGAYVGRETLHEPGGDRVVDHYRSVGVLELPEGIAPELEAVTTLRLPLMAGDVYVDAEDPTRFVRILHFGLQNLYDPNLDEWLVIDDADPVAGEVDLPAECAAVGPDGNGDSTESD